LVDSAVFRKVGVRLRLHIIVCGSCVDFVRSVDGLPRTSLRLYAKTCSGESCPRACQQSRCVNRHYTFEETISIHVVVTRQLGVWWSTRARQWVWMGGVRYVDGWVEPRIWGVAGEQAREVGKGKKGKGKGKKGKPGKTGKGK
jgi:hypothetical protein